MKQSSFDSLLARFAPWALWVALLHVIVAELPASAQSPAWSRGVQSLSVSYDECVNRARRALEAEGFSVSTQGGDGRNDFHFGGSKGLHSAVITCDSAPNNSTWVNVFVASQSLDGSVPGAERVRLQQRMANPAGGTSQGGGLGNWREVGTGDCTGSDVGSSQGPNPEANRCSPATAGLTAICWGSWCTYKNVPARSCTGGANPGRMFTCELTPSARPQQGGGSGGSIGDWMEVGTGDCSGNDVANSQGPNPEANRCSPATAGLTAVCWGSWCTYKNVPAGSCTGGANPGRMYTCRPAGLTQPVTGRQGGGPCSDRRTQGILDDWLAAANPPENQRPGWSVRYDSWGRLVGRTPTNTISGLPQGVDTPLTQCEYLLSIAASLNSTNLGTLQSYLDKKLR
ncbi:MAG: hypothetical protein L6R30_24265 [Thermoanaerobaculia bacterium]|nr:hypothetical protein [Thermoanaerobaculia bacterium]